MEDLADFDTDPEHPSAEDSGPVAPGPELDFEHRRIRASVHSRLFGERSELQIGRFRVLGRAGAGGMGEVYLCHDDELGRKVAIKRLIGLGDPRDQNRLRREARALARLSHHNVVQVYEMGTHEGCPFLVMEYIDGQTLGAWLESSRSRSAIIEHFLAAGRGLAAAHAVGIIHRDFKPENVLICGDGTTRVVDFGIAVAAKGPSQEPSQGPIALHEQLGTGGTGSVAGTIRYMPLEQLLGGELDARSDQFAFCVALYEAVWGAPPFPLSDLRTRVEALEQGRPTPPRGSRALWRLIRRGLSRDPADRWPDMPTLLDLLARAPRRGRRVLTTLTVFAGVVGGLTFAPSLRRADPCAQLELELEGIWDLEQRTELKRHVDGLEGAHVEDSKRRVLAHLDDWRRQWLVERERVCRTRVATGARATSHLEVHEACLIRQRQQVRHLVTLIGSADRQILADAVLAAAQLPSPEGCAALRLQGVEPPPLELADQVEALREELARVRMLRAAGQLGEALDAAEANDAVALGIGYGPLVAEARAERARAEFEAGVRGRSVRLYEQAIMLAGTHRHEWLRAELLIERSLLALHEPGDAEDGRAWLSQAESSRRRLGIQDPRLLAELGFARGRIFELEGVRAEAAREYGGAIAALEDSPCEGSSTYLDALARVVDEGTLELRRSALELARECYGPLHPRTARWLYNYGVEASERGLGQGELELAAEIWISSGRSPHRLARALSVLAKRALQDRKFDRASSYANELASLNAQLLRPNHPDHGIPAQILAAVEGARGNHEAALEHARAAIAAFERSEGPRPDLRALSMRCEVGNKLLSRGLVDEAGAAFSEALARSQRSPRFEVCARLGLVEVALRRDKLGRARAELEHIDRLGLPTHADSSLIHALLSALVAVRSGGLSSTQVESLRATLEAQGTFTSEQLFAWFGELGLSRDEAQTLLGLELQ